MKKKTPPGVSNTKEITKTYGIFLLVLFGLAIICTLVYMAFKIELA